MWHEKAICRFSAHQTVKDFAEAKIQESFAQVAMGATIFPGGVAEDCYLATPGRGKGQFGTLVVKTNYVDGSAKFIYPADATEATLHKFKLHHVGLTMRQQNKTDGTWTNPMTLHEFKVNAEANREVSHLCHVPNCIRTNHLAFESKKINQSRNMCSYTVECDDCHKVVDACKHIPKCKRANPKVESYYRDGAQTSHSEAIDTDPEEVDDDSDADV